MAKGRISIPLPVGGMSSAGDSGAAASNTVRVMENMLPRPNRIASRPPFTYDNVMNVNGLANFDDPSNKVSRAVSIDTTGHVYTKSATMGSETWGSANATTLTAARRLTDSATYRGVLYGMLDDGSGLPGSAFSYDGTTINTTPFNSAIQGRTVTSFIDRLFIDYPRVTFTNKLNNTDSYRWDNAAHWTPTNVTVKLIAVSGTTVTRLYPTSTTASKIEAYNSGVSPNIGLFTATSSASEQPFVWRQDLRSQDATYAMPVKLEIYIFTQWVANTVYAAGDVVADSNGKRQRCTTGGTSANPGPPAWATTVGAATVDNTVTWTMEGSASIGTLEGTIPPITSAGTWTTFQCVGSLPPCTNTQQVALRFSFGNTATPTIQLAPIDVALRDALTDGDARKKNYGGQVTAGDFLFPFFNLESSSAATVDLQSIVWSEIREPKRIRAANTQEITEFVGYPTAAKVISGRRITFGRNGFVQYQGTTDPDIPIRRERYDSYIGCLGSQALDVYEDEVFFIGENGIYRMTVGSAPQEICGEGMREEIMNKASAGWVELQSTYKRPLLKIDKNKLIVWVYTQKSKLYAYDLRNNIWSRHTCPNSSEVDAMLWNENTDSFYVAFSSATYGLTRMDYSTAANDTIDNTATPYTVSKTITFNPIELSGENGAGRYEATLEEIRLLHAATASQASQTVTASYSFDQGTTYPKSTAKTIAPLSAGGEFLPLPFEAYQTAPSVTVKVVHAGKAGETVWGISPRAYANINVRRGEYIQTNPTAGSATL